MKSSCWFSIFDHFGAFVLLRGSTNECHARNSGNGLFLSVLAISGAFSTSLVISSMVGEFFVHPLDFASSMALFLFSSLYMRARAWHLSMVVAKYLS